MEEEGTTAHTDPLQAKESVHPSAKVVSQWEETPYEAEVLDLTRVELRIDQLVGGCGYLCVM